MVYSLRGTVIRYSSLSLMVIATAMSVSFCVNEGERSGRNAGFLTTLGYALRISLPALLFLTGIVGIVITESYKSREEVLRVYYFIFLGMILSTFAFLLWGMISLQELLKEGGSNATVASNHLSNAGWPSMHWSQQMYFIEQWIVVWPIGILLLIDLWIIITRTYTDVQAVRQYAIENVESLYSHYDETFPRASQVKHYDAMALPGQRASAGETRLKSEKRPSRNSVLSRNFAADEELYGFARPPSKSS